MVIHTLIELLTLVHEFREQSVELAHHLRVAQALCKFVPDGDHSTDRTTRLPQPPFRVPGLPLLLLLQSLCNSTFLFNNYQNIIFSYRVLNFISLLSNLISY